MLELFQIGKDEHGRKKYLLKIGEFWIYGTLISANLKSSYVLSDFSLGKSDVNIRKALS